MAEAFFSFIPKAVKVARKVPAIDDSLSRIQMGLLNPVGVRRVTEVTDSDLHAALELYDKRISDGLRFQSADIIRWIANDKKHALVGDTSPRDYFFIAKLKRKVRAFVLFHYYPAVKIAFLAYMVVDKNISGVPIDQLSRTLVSHIAGLLRRDKVLRNCEILLFEVEDPRALAKAKQLEAIARIQRFCSLAVCEKFSLLGFDVNYLQPQLALPSDSLNNEVPLLLLYARAPQAQRAPDIKGELLKALDFIYKDLYPEGFSDIYEEQEAYQLYCESLHALVVANLPAKIGIINPIHLTCGRTVRRASRKLPTPKD